MATDFKILRGNKGTLITDEGVVLIEDKLVNGYWYLTNDTAEVFVCLPDTQTGKLTLKKINECNADIDFPEMESFEERLTALEADHTHVYGYRKDFPSVGERDHIYVAEDEHRTYIYAENRYIHIADKFDAEDHDNDDNTPEVRIIFGGTAD